MSIIFISIKIFCYSIAIAISNYMNHLVEYDFNRIIMLLTPDRFILFFFLFFSLMETIGIENNGDDKNIASVAQHIYCSASQRRG